MLAPCRCIASAMPHAMLRSFATPKTRTRLPSNRRVALMARTPWLNASGRSLEDVESAGEVFSGEDPERDERHGALDAADLRELFRNHLGDPLPLRYADDRDQVPVAGDGIDFGYAIDISDFAGCR